MTLPDEVRIRAVMRPGIIRVNATTSLSMDTVLWDSGAISSSFISRSYLARHIDILQDKLIYRPGTVTLGNNKSTTECTHIAILDVEFIGDFNDVYRATLPFWVLDNGMHSYDIIVGLPAILIYFSNLFIQMITDASATYQAPLHLIEFPSDTTFDEPVEPWTIPLLDDAEEDDLPTPSSFPTVLYFMERTTEQAIQEYRDEIMSHVDPAFLLACPELTDYLLTYAYQVFIPTEWTGLKIPPIHLDTTPDIPPHMKARARPVNPKLFGHAQAEVYRLFTYMYRTSTSPRTCPIVIAPKPTSPFIRICGDYTPINPYILMRHYPIPQVFHQLQKIQKFSIFLDIDMRNSFHQIPIDDSTSALLSIVTLWGQYEPMFLPEGVTPASNILQQVVTEIFSGFEDWMIVIFDNFLVLAHTYEDAFEKFKLVVERAKTFNLFFRFQKTWLGQRKVTFFGYECSEHSFQLSDDRKAGIVNLAFPTSIKTMQSFLGAANFFSKFVPRYTDYTAALYEMTCKDFNWNDKTTWKKPYEDNFNEFKEALIQAMPLFYPDYDLEWVLRTDASDVGVGAVLFQVKPQEDKTTQIQPISFSSQKFSDTATRWNTIEKECYGCYFGVKQSQYLLRCKQFALETDHRNLLWMEKSTEPKIMRWTMYLQGFNFLIRHIKGTENKVADYMSRFFDMKPLQDTPTMAAIHSTVYNMCALFSFLESDHILGASMDEVDSILDTIHNARQGHWGQRYMMKALDDKYPGHKIPWKVVADYLSRCAVCQKLRQEMIDSLKPTVRHLKPPHQRFSIGIDFLTITPTDDAGNEYLTVIIVHHSKLAFRRPSKAKDAPSTADALISFVSLYGMFDEVYSDPGSDYMSDAIQQLLQYLGMHHIVSLVDRHESNGVEGSNKQILRHLRALALEEHIAKQWSKPSVLALVFFILNSHVSSETGISPFHAHFGTEAAVYFQPPAHLTPTEKQHIFVRQLDENLRHLQAATQEFQNELVAERTKNNPIEAEHNMYQPGDLVLFRESDERPLPTKLSPRYKGPYEVIKQDKNDVECRHLGNGRVYLPFFVERLKRFYGTRDEAIEVARTDFGQFVIRRFLAYRGNPMKRTSVEFEVEFEDGDVLWLPWSKDIFDSQPYEDYCRSLPQLRPLIYTHQEAANIIKQMKRDTITLVQPGQTVYVDIRSYDKSSNGTWYDSLTLPGKYHISYYIEHTYGHTVSSGHKIKLYCVLFDENYIENNEFVTFYGTYLAVPTNGVLLTPSLALQHPDILPTHKKKHLMRRFEHI